MVLVGRRAGAAPGRGFRQGREIRARAARRQISRHFSERRSAGPHRLGQRKIRQLQPRVLHQCLRIAAAVEGQLSLAGDVEQLFQRRRSAESQTGRRIRHRHGHLARRADDAGGQGMEPAGYTAREWNYLTHSNLLDSFWNDGIERNKNYENIITIAMRGKIDTPMSETANISLLEEIVAAQRKIIADVYQTNAAAVPQDWALYKEVQEYYEKGMRVPDDVTLLWCDDNWGDIRRLPSPGSRKRSGGAGSLLPFRLRRRAAQLQMAQHKSDHQNLGADESGVSIRRATGFGSSTSATSRATNFPIEFFLSLAWNPGAVAEGKNLRIHPAVGGTRIWPGIRGANRRYYVQIHQVQRPAQTGAAGSGHLQPGGLSGGGQGARRLEIPHRRGGGNLPETAGGRARCLL